MAEKQTQGETVTKYQPDENSGCLKVLLNGCDLKCGLSSVKCVDLFVVL